MWHWSEAKWNQILFPSTGDMHTSACFKTVSKCKISKNLQHLNSRTFQGFWSTFKHLICFQALSRALKFLLKIQAFSMISQAHYEPWTEQKQMPRNVSVLQTGTKWEMGRDCETSDNTSPNSARRYCRFAAVGPVIRRYQSTAALYEALNPLTLSKDYLNPFYFLSLISWPFIPSYSMLYLFLVLICVTHPCNVPWHVTARCK